jgi:hypothetical protein
MLADFAYAFLGFFSELFLVQKTLGGASAIRLGPPASNKIKHADVF